MKANTTDPNAADWLWSLEDNPRIERTLWLENPCVSGISPAASTICPGETIGLTANGLTSGSARQWWIDVGPGGSGTYEAGTDINLGTGATATVTGGGPGLPPGSTATVRMRESVTSGMNTTVTNASATVTVRLVPVPPVALDVCRTDNDINLATLIPSASGFSGRDGNLSLPFAERHADGGAGHHAE